MNIINSIPQIFCKFLNSKASIVAWSMMGALRGTTIGTLTLLFNGAHSITLEEYAELCKRSHKCALCLCYFSWDGYQQHIKYDMVCRNMPKLESGEINLFILCSLLTPCQFLIWRLFSLLCCQSLLNDGLLGLFLSLKMLPMELWAWLGWTDTIILVSCMTIGLTWLWLGDRVLANVKESDHLWDMPVTSKRILIAALWVMPMFHLKNFGCFVSLKITCICFKS